MGRPLGSKNKKTSQRSLIDDITSQEERFVERENTKVLDVATGNNESESDSDYEQSDSESDDSLDVSISSTTSSQPASPVVTSKAATSTAKVAESSSEATSSSSKSTSSSSKATSRTSTAKAAPTKEASLKHQISSSQPVIALAVIYLLKIFRNIEVNKFNQCKTKYIDK